MGAWARKQETTTPRWIVRSTSQVSYLHWLGYRRYADTGLLWPAGVCATLDWVGNRRNAPLTERNEQPVTDRLAKAEMWTAMAVDGDDAKQSHHLRYQRTAPMAAFPVLMNFMCGQWQPILTATGDQRNARRSGPK